MPAHLRDLLRRRLSAHGAPQHFSAPPGRHAVVAAIFRTQTLVRPALADSRMGSQETEAAELLLIERAVQPGDPWSGDIAFPGGHREAGDADLLATAHRETAEEVGLALADHAEPIGRLASVPIQRAVNRPHLEVIPIVFWWQEPAATLRLDRAEVQNAFWISIEALCAPAAQTVHILRKPRCTYRFPATRVQGRLLWGLTHAIVQQLLEPTERFDNSGRPTP